MAKTPPKIAKRIDGYADKYMGILGIAGQRPSVKIVDDPSADWLGRLDWSSKHPHTSVMELQKRLLKSDKHLERVVAHEMIHHRDFVEMPDDKIDRIEAGLVPDEPKKHSASFAEGAASVNAIMGQGFVVKEESRKKLPAYLLPERSFSTKLLIAVGLGGLTLLGATLLQHDQPPARSVRENERGSYGKRY